MSATALGTSVPNLGSSENSAFHLHITGQVESGHFGGADNLYCKYCFTQGPDWLIVAGHEGSIGGVSQIAKKGPRSDSDEFGGAVVWNFPFDVVFKSTNAFGWPRLVVTVYGVDALGRDVTYGYGSMLIPTSPGNYERYMDIYAPKPSSLLQKITNYVTGAYPEFFDSAFVAQGFNREVTRTEHTGAVKVQVQVGTKDMKRFGYQS